MAGKVTKKYPECEKMAAVKDQSQAIGEFLEWLQNEKWITLCEMMEGENEMGEYVPTHPNMEKLLAEFFEIDLKKVEQERRQMLDELRKNQK